MPTQGWTDGATSAFGNNQTTQISEGMIIFAKYNASGSAVWANATGPNDVNNAFMMIYDMAVEPQGNQLYISGAYVMTISGIYIQHERCTLSITPPPLSRVLTQQGVLCPLHLRRTVGGDRHKSILWLRF